MTNSKRNPDPRYETHIWSISANNTLYVGGKASQVPSNKSPTCLGSILQISHQQKHTPPASSGLGTRQSVFKVLVQPRAPQTNPDLSPVLPTSKWWLLTERLFDDFDHVNGWKTPPNLVAAFQAYEDNPKSSKYKAGRWFKDHFKLDHQDDVNTSFSRGGVVTIPGTGPTKASASSSARRSLSTVVAGAASSSLDVFSSGRSDKGRSTGLTVAGEMCLSQNSVQPPPTIPGMIFQLRADERRTNPTKTFTFYDELRNHP